jgi:flavin reductase (DIM6/NTAB) family NADH-FMN oxidoreductase RutF
MLKSTKNTVMHSYPGMVALVTSKHLEEVNIMSAGWHTYISYEPPIYGVAIAKERYSHKLITDSKEFAINFLPGHMASIIQESGSVSGRQVNKLANLKYFDGETINSPILKDAYIAYECKVMDVRTYGDHEWIVGDITNFYRDEQKFLENGLPNFHELTIPLYLGRSQYLMANEKNELKNYYNVNRD